MGTQREEAVCTFQKGYNCAQSVLASLAPELGISREQALKLASAFGGGMARRGDTCGAVVGAMIALGMKHGSSDPAAKEQVYSRVWKFMDEFRARHRSVICRDLLGCDMGTEEGRKQAHDSGITRQRCPVFIGDAVEIFEKMS